MEPGNESESSQSLECEFRRSDLAVIWAELVAAARTDSKARKFVEYFRPDADRLFGTRLPTEAAFVAGALLESLEVLEIGDRKVLVKTRCQ